MLDIDRAECWPALPLNEWESTRATLHMWTQMVGKVRLALTPLVNHWWNVTLYVDSRGLTTSLIPYGSRAFEIRFDFIEHELVLEDSHGLVKRLALAPRSVADFYRDFLNLLRSARIEVKIWPVPSEIAGPVRFDQDHEHAAYDREYVERFWRILLSVNSVFGQFRARFVGKSSPVHFFWGSFDLAVSRFSGRRAPEQPNADAMTREGYSHEVSSVGFWPGSGDIKDAAFYSYTAPPPQGFGQAPVKPEGAFFLPKLGEFVLMYEDIRKAASPSTALREFCQTTYEAGATLGHWDRAALEK